MVLKDSDIDKNMDTEEIVLPHRKDRVSVVLIGIGLLLLVSLFFKFILTSQNAVDESEIRSLEARIRQLETKLAKLEMIEAKLTEIEKKGDKHASTLMQRVNQLEESICSITAAMPEGRGISETKPAEAEPIFHKVCPGETLYYISRRYGLPVEELLRLNNLDSKTVIHPGQRLKVRKVNEP